MESTSAVQQAIELLVRRHNEAQQQMGGLRAEIDSIEHALTALGYRSTENNSVVSEFSEPLRMSAASTAGLSIRAFVKSVLESENRPFTPAEVRSMVPADVRGDRTNEQFTASVRTAFWSLRKHGDAMLLDGDRTLAAKWRRDAEAAVPAAASVGNTPHRMEGGDSHEAAQASQAEGDDHSHLGASIAEVAG